MILLCISGIFLCSWLFLQVKGNGKKYFVYVDATTGEEINILCVIDSEQGRLLM